MLGALCLGLIGPGVPVVMAAVPRGTADVSLSPASVSGLVAGQTITLTVSVEPNNVTVDAAAVALRFDPRYLSLDQSGVGAGGALDTILAQSLDGTAGTLWYAGGKLGGPWPSGTFTLVTLSFRVVALPPSSTTVELVTTGTNRTSVASNGQSVLNATHGATLTLVTPTATSAPVLVVPTPEPTEEPTAVPRVSAGGGGGGGGASGGASASAAANPTPGPAAAVPGTVPGPQAPAAALVAGEVPPLPETVRVGAMPVAPSFATFYEGHEGLRVLGNTLGSERVAGGNTVQYFEKGRAEDHPEESNPLWRVQYGLLVDELVNAGAPLPVGGDASTLTYAGIRGLAAPAQRVPPPDGFPGGTALLADGSTFVPFSAALLPEAGHAVPADFWGYVNREDLFPGGWLHDIGLPITEPVAVVVDKGPALGRSITVQAFQRTILTYDPLNPPDYVVERANVGTDYARAFPALFRSP